MTVKRSIKPTKREIDVLHFAVRGESNKSIAQNMGIAVTTVKDYRQKIKFRFGAKSFIHAVAIAAARGMVEVPGA